MSVYVDPYEEDNSIDDIQKEHSIDVQKELIGKIQKAANLIDRQGSANYIVGSADFIEEFNEAIKDYEFQQVIEKRFKNLNQFIDETGDKETGRD